MADDIKIAPLFSEEEIAARITEMAAQIAAIPHKKLLIVVVLRGSFIFSADLVRALHRAGLEPEVEFIQIESYRTGTRGGEVRVLRDIGADLVAGRNVIIVDDILESGNTLVHAVRNIEQKQARSVDIAVLLDKSTHRPPAGITARYVGFECPDKFVVGYGMDLAHRWRELPFIGHIIQGNSSS